MTLSSIPSLNGINFRRLIEQPYQIHLYVDNDINIQLADLQFTCEELSGAKSILYFGIRSQGVGLSIATEGKLYRGNHNLSGNITLFDQRKSMEDILCDIEKKLLSRQDFDPSRLNLSAGEALQEEHLAYALQRGDSEVSNCVKDTLREMSEGIGMLQRVFDTEYIVIACPLFAHDLSLFDFMVHACDEICSSPYNKTKYVPIILNDDQFAVNSARCVFRSIYAHAAD